MNTFKNGDVVKLKSGGIQMTVTKVVGHWKTNKPNGVIICQWTEGEVLKEAEFSYDSLVMV